MMNASLEKLARCAVVYFRFQARILEAMIHPSSDA
jgi:hypothetical protein